MSLSGGTKAELKWLFLLTVDKTLFAMVTLTIWTTQTVTTPLNSHTSKILDCILKKIKKILGY